MTAVLCITLARKIAKDKGINLNVMLKAPPMAAELLKDIEGFYAGCASSSRKWR